MAATTLGLNDTDALFGPIVSDFLSSFNNIYIDHNLLNTQCGERRRVATMNLGPNNARCIIWVKYMKKKRKKLTNAQMMHLALFGPIFIVATLLLSPHCVFRRL